MIQPKFLVAALAFVGLLTTSGIAKAEANLYVEFGATWADGENVAAEFTTENEGAVWDISDLEGGKLEIGVDFGVFRAGVKGRIFDGEVDAISGVTDVNSGGNNFGTIETTDPEGPNALLGVATINAYWDITDFEAGVTSFTPFVGIGIGRAFGFMQAQGELGGVRRVDHRNDEGQAITGTVGALFSVGPIGLTADYEYIDTNVGGINAHTYSAGLRLAF